MIDALARQPRIRRSPAGCPPGDGFHPLTLDDLAAYIAACTREVTREYTWEALQRLRSAHSGQTFD